MFGYSGLLPLDCEHSGLSRVTQATLDHPGSPGIQESLRLRLRLRLSLRLLRLCSSGGPSLLYLLQWSSSSGPPPVVLLRWCSSMVPVVLSGATVNISHFRHTFNMTSSFPLLTRRSTYQVNNTIMYMCMLNCSPLLQYRYNTGTIPVQYRYNTGTIPVQYRYNTGTIPVQYRYNTGTIPVQYRYNTGTIPVQYPGCPFVQVHVHVCDRHYVSRMTGYI